MTRLYHKLPDEMLLEQQRRERRSVRLNRFLTLLAVAMVLTVSGLVLFVWLLTQA
jgi:hypothetical protein